MPFSNYSLRFFHLSLVFCSRDSANVLGAMLGLPGIDELSIAKTVCFPSEGVHIIVSLPGRCIDASNTSTEAQMFCVKFSYVADRYSLILAALDFLDSITAKIC